MKQDFFLLDKKRLKFLNLFLLGVMLTGCYSPTNTEEKQFTHTDKSQRALTLNILSRIDEGRLTEASTLVNAALQKNSDNAFLHMANGLIYKEMAKKDPSKNELAEVALARAVSLDASQHYAPYIMANHLFAKKQYRAAQEYYAKSLKLRPNQPKALLELSIASYYAGDIGAALWAAKSALKLSPNCVFTQRAAAIIFSAAGQEKDAQMVLTKLKKTGEQPWLPHLQERMTFWSNIYKTAATLPPPPASGQGEEEGEEGGEEGEEGNKGGGTSPLPAAQKLPAAHLNKESSNGINSVVFECHILKIFNETSDSFGYNVLNSKEGLFFSFLPKTAELEMQGGVKTWTCRRSLKPPELKYNINIANAVDSCIKVDASPTFQAFLNSPAAFSSGDEYRAGITGGYSGSVASIKAGLEVKILVVKITDKSVRFKIEFSGAMLPEAVPDKGISEQLLKLSKSSISTEMEIPFEKTVMLAGLVEKTYEKNNSGVPGLRDIPLIKYLFSTGQLRKRNNNILMVVTVYKTGTEEKRIFVGLGKQQRPQTLIGLMNEGSLLQVSSRLPALYGSFARHGMAFHVRTGDIPQPPENDMNIKEQINQASRAFFT